MSLLGPGRFTDRPAETDQYRRGYLCGAIRCDAQEPEARGRVAAYLAHYGIEDPGDRPHSLATIARADRVESLIVWPFEPGIDWRKGFLAGVFDAEGVVDGEELRIAGADATILSWVDASLASFGFTAPLLPPDPLGVRTLRVQGGVREQLRFSHLTWPAATAKWSLAGRPIKTNAPLRVEAIEPVSAEPIELYDITTGTGDFIANGVVSHNCFARPTHKYLDFDAGRDFEREIVVKVNVPEVLRAELRRPSWKGEHIAMGTNTDPYQWVEGRYRLMQGIWEALRDFRNPCSVLTKSPLVLRDLPLLKEIAAVTEVSANLSIPTIDEKAWRATEPHTPNPRARLEAVAELNRAGIPTGILVAPLMPGINDDPEAGRGDHPDGDRRGGDVASAGSALHLRGEVRGRVHGVAARVPARPRGALRGAVRARRVPAAGRAGPRRPAAARRRRARAAAVPARPGRRPAVRAHVPAADGPRDRVDRPRGACRAG